MTTHRIKKATNRTAHFGCGGVQVGTGNNGFTNRNKKVFEEAQNGEGIPRKYVPLAPSVLGIKPEEVNVKED